MVEPYRCRSTPSLFIELAHKSGLTMSARFICFSLFIKSGPYDVKMMWKNLSKMFSYSVKSIAISRIVNADIFVRNFVEIFPGIQSYRIIQLKDLYGTFSRNKKFQHKIKISNIQEKYGYFKIKFYLCSQ